MIAAFYGCLYAGCVPITVRPPHPQNIATTLPTVKMIVEVGVDLKSFLILFDLKKKWLLMYEFVFRWADRLVWWPHRSFLSSWSQRRRLPQWTSGCGLLFWTQVRVGQRSDSFLTSKWTLIYYLTCFPDDLPKKKPPQLYKPSNPDTLAYLDFSVSTTGMLAGVKVSINHPLLCEIRNPCSLFPQHKKNRKKSLKTHLTDIKTSQLVAGEIRCHMHWGSFLLYCLEMKTRF